MYDTDEMEEEQSTCKQCVCHCHSIVDKLFFSFIARRKALNGTPKRKRIDDEAKVCLFIQLHCAVVTVRIFL